MVQQKTIQLTSTEQLLYNKLSRKKLVHRSGVDRCINFIYRNNLTFIDGCRKRYIFSDVFDLN